MADSVVDHGDGTPRTTCVICCKEYILRDIATNNGCSHNFCVVCIVTWTRRNNSCPMCRNPMEYIFTSDDQTFKVPGEYTTFRVEVGPSSYVDAQYRIKTRPGKMLEELAGYEEWLASVRGYREKVYFYFRGVLLDKRIRLRHFFNVQQGEVITAEVGMTVTFEYAGSRLHKYRLTYRGMSRTNITVYESKFKSDYFRRVGSNLDVEFEYYLHGRRMSALGDYVPPYIDLDGHTIVARESGYTLGGRPRESTLLLGGC